MYPRTTVNKGYSHRDLRPAKESNSEVVRDALLGAILCSIKYPVVLWEIFSHCKSSRLVTAQNVSY